MANTNATQSLPARLAQAERTLKARSKPRQAEAVAEARNVLHRIVEQLDGVEWSADTADEIAFILRGAGYEIGDVAEYDDE